MKMPQAVAEKKLDLAPVARIVAARAPFTEGDAISALQDMQDAYGYLPRQALDELARLTGIPVAKLYGVATFYGQFFLQPHGKHTVRLCRGTACHVRSAPKILSAVSRHLGVGDGQTTEDMVFSLETVACLGTCFLSPVMLVDSQYFGQLTPDRAVKVLETIRGAGRPEGG
ncbi:MAG: NADH-quinone oxidoreductase subunit NuoE [Planctomycetes bacterium]|nr:NADH-quinone oxidoreductase subunit NuoE [Planctomycetota bacterium]